MSATANSQRSTAKPRHRLRSFLLAVLALVLVLLVAWTTYVVHQINGVAKEDQAQSADAIAVFGAAEYNGRPSPIYHARLDHAVALYEKKIAPLVITLGGGGDRDSGKTEGGVGRDYLLANGIPFDDIVAETHSISTDQQVQLLAGIARQRRLRRIVVVSDGTHLFRIRELCAEAGLEVYTSPRPALGHIGTWDLWMRYLHEVVSYTALQMNLNGTFLHRWTDGKVDE